MNSWIAEGATLGELGRDEEALAVYDRAIELEPHLPQPWSGKGYAFFLLGRSEEGLAALDRAIVLDPVRSLAWQRRGEVLASAGRREGAIRSLCMAWQGRERLEDGGTETAQLLESLGWSVDRCEESEDHPVF